MSLTIYRAKEEDGGYLYTQYEIDATTPYHALRQLASAFKDMIKEEYVGTMPFGKWTDTRVEKVLEDIKRRQDRVYLRDGLNYTGYPGWQVAWEEGPYEWAMSVSAQRNLYTGDYDHPTILYGAFRGYGNDFFFEPVNSYTMAAYKL